MKTVSSKVPRDVGEKIDNLADKREITRSRAIRDLIETGFEAKSRPQIPDDVQQQVEQFAREQQIDKTEAIRQLVDEGINSYRKPTIFRSIVYSLFTFAYVYIFLSSPTSTVIAATGVGVATGFLYYILRYGGFQVLIRIPDKANLKDRITQWREKIQNIP